MTDKKKTTNQKSIEKISGYSDKDFADVIARLSIGFAKDADEFMDIAHDTTTAVKNQDMSLMMHQDASSHAIVFAILERIFKKQIELEEKINKHILNIPVARIQT